MNVKRKAIMTALMGVGLASSGAQASLLLQGWDLHLGAVAGQGLGGTVMGIDEITYRGLTRAVQQDLGAAGPSIGDTAQFYGALTATSYTIGGATTPGFPIGGGLGIGYEMTFTFEVDSIIDNLSATTQHQTHTNPVLTTGLLKIYIDNLAFGPGVGVQANNHSGLGYDDGTNIATFKVLSGGGGPFSFVTLDGSDDATFELVSALPGVFTKGGGDLATMAGELLIMADSNFDADSDANGAFSGFPVPTNTAVFGGGCAALSTSCFFADEDGSAVLATLATNPVPEPASMLLIGSGLIGLWGAGRRKLNA